MARFTALSRARGVLIGFATYCLTAAALLGHGASIGAGPFA